MTKVEQYKVENDCEICVDNGKVSAVDTNYNLTTIGLIERVSVSVEEPENMIGIFRVEHIMLYDENDDELYDDQSMVNNDEFHSEKELVRHLAEHYGVSVDIIETI